MSRLLPIEPIEVRIGDCECPGTPHPDGDKAWLRPRLTAKGGMTATYLIVNNDGDPTRLSRDLGMCFLVDGLVRWNLLDEDGNPIPTDEDTLTSGALDWDSTLLPIANAANDVYQESVLRPFRPAKALESSPSGPTDASTSPNTES